jgi:hypothetical protein
LTLPDGVKVVVEERKVRDYLLSPTHPIGRLKAAFFGTLGFGPEDPTDLVNALEAHASGGEVMGRESTRYGTKYVVEGELRGPVGSARVRSVWIADHSGGILRLVTAYPAPKEGSAR